MCGGHFARRLLLLLHRPLGVLLSPMAHCKQMDTEKEMELAFIIKEFRGCNLPFFKLDLNPLPLLCAASFTEPHNAQLHIRSLQTPRDNGSILENLPPIWKPGWMSNHSALYHSILEVLWKVQHTLILKVLGFENFPSSEPRLKNVTLTLATIRDLSTLQHISHVFKTRDCFLSWYINQKVCFFSDRYIFSFTFPPTNRDCLTIHKNNRRGSSVPRVRSVWRSPMFTCTSMRRG